MITRYVESNLTWIDLVSPTPAEVRSLMHEFNIDPLIAQELLVPSYKPKVERRGEAVYVILHFPTAHGSTKHVSQEVDFVIGKEFLITTRYTDIDPLHAFAKAFEVQSVLNTHNKEATGGHLFIAMARTLYQALDHECDTLHRRLSDIEEHIFNGDERRMVVELSQTGRVIHDFRQIILPHKEMLGSFEPVAMRLFGNDFSFHVRMVMGEYERVRQTLEHIKDSLTELRETNNSLLTTKQNEIMKKFTILAFFFLPVSFIASIFGMNTEHTPFMGMPGDFYIVVAFMLVTAVVCYTYFHKKGWL